MFSSTITYVDNQIKILHIFLKKNLCGLSILFGINFIWNIKTCPYVLVMKHLAILFLFHDLPHLYKKQAKIFLRGYLTRYISVYLLYSMQNINRSFYRTEYICVRSETAKKYHKLPNVVFVSYFAQSSCTIP